jgi:hypothetical protein
MNLPTAKPLYKVYLDAIDRANQTLSFVSSGLAPSTATGLSVAIATGVAVVNKGRYASAAAGTVTLPTADATNPRVDTIHATATTLSNSPIAGATTLQTAVSVPIGSSITIGVGTSTAETRTTTGLSGAGPYTLTVAALTSGHTSGDSVLVVGFSVGTPATPPIPTALPTNAALISVVNVAANQATLASGDITDARMIYGAGLTGVGPGNGSTITFLANWSLEKASTLDQASTAAVIRNSQTAGGSNSFTFGAIMEVEVSGGSGSSTQHAVGGFGHAIVDTGAPNQYHYGLEGRTDIDSTTIGLGGGAIGTLGMVEIGAAPAGPVMHRGVEGRIDFASGTTGTANMYIEGGHFELNITESAQQGSLGYGRHVRIGSDSNNLPSEIRGYLGGTGAQTGSGVLFGMYNDTASQEERGLRWTFNASENARSFIIKFGAAVGKFCVKNYTTDADIFRVYGDGSVDLQVQATDPANPVSGYRRLFYSQGADALTLMADTGKRRSLEAPTTHTDRLMEQMVNPGAATITTVGFGAAPTLTGTAASADDADNPWNSLTTSAVANNAVGWESPYTICRRDWGAETVILLKTGATITSVRYWAGVASADLEGASSPAAHIAAFRYDTGADGTVFWRTVTKDGTTINALATTTAIAANTMYTLRIQMQAAAVRFYINDILVNTHTTNLPTATQLMGWQVKATTLTTAARVILWGRTAMTH